MADNTFNLDAYRAAHADEAEAKSVEVGGESIPLPSSIPALAVEHLANGRVAACLVELAGEEGAKVLFSVGLTLEELGALISDLYGISAGN